MKVAKISGSQTTRIGIPMSRPIGPHDTEGYYRRARGEEPIVARNYITTSGLRALNARSSISVPLPTTRSYVFVNEGNISLATEGASLELRAGESAVVEGTATLSTEAARVLVLDDLSEIDDVESEVELETSFRAPDQPANNGIMYKADDDLSYFRRFPELFDTPANELSAPRPITGLFFVEFPKDDYIGMHPEVLNQFVMMLSGELELEVSGSGEIQVFRTGDIAFAADRTGMGHIDRFHQTSVLAILVIEDEHLWS